jgi:DNA uptake protein ComE-like DNA-binding protein
MGNERCLSNKFQAKKLKAHNQKLEIRKLQDQLKQASKKKTQIAVRRFGAIREEDEQKAMNQEAKLQLRQEIEEGLDPEQQVFDEVKKLGGRL